MPARMAQPHQPVPRRPAPRRPLPRQPVTFRASPCPVGWTLAALALACATAVGLASGVAVGVGPARLAATPAPASAHAPRWRWPLTPRPPVIHRFAPPAHRWQAGHRGVDLAGAPGQVVRAAGPGTVTFAGVIAGRGVVVVSHGALRTTYEPVLASVQVGSTVRAGDPIGVLALAGGHCRPVTPCLHWGLLRGAVYLDPLRLVWAGPARLLPLGRPGAAAGHAPS